MKSTNSSTQSTRHQFNLRCVSIVIPHKIALKRSCSILDNVDRKILPQKAKKVEILLSHRAFPNQHSRWWTLSKRGSFAKHSGLPIIPCARRNQDGGFTEPKCVTIWNGKYHLLRCLLNDYLGEEYVLTQGHPLLRIMFALMTILFLSARVNLLSRGRLRLRVALLFLFYFHIRCTHLPVVSVTSRCSKT